MNQKIAVPPYVDTKTSPKKWYAFHIGILVASLGMLGIAALVLEYELAKLQNPLVSFIETPVYLVVALAGTVAALALINISVLIFVFLRHLWLRQWMLGTTIAGWMLIAVLALVLQYRFLPILLPWYR